MATLLAGPWVGEFGWELMVWQGYLRKIAKNYERVYVFGPVGHEVLYRDFSFAYFGNKISGVKDCYFCTSKEQVAKENQVIERDFKGERLNPAMRLGKRPWTKEEQTFVRLGVAGEAGYEVSVLVHARAPIGKCPHHAWGLAHAAECVAALSGYSVASIGSPDGALYVPGTRDLRGVSLETLTNYMAGARVVVGPSSGPMHLASLCGTPHVVWTDDKVYSAIGATNRRRYEELWNPFGTACTVLDQQGWSPDCKSVVEAVRKFL